MRPNVYATKNIEDHKGDMVDDIHKQEVGNEIEVYSKRSKKRKLGEMAWTEEHFAFLHRQHVLSLCSAMLA